MLSTLKAVGKTVGKKMGVVNFELEEFKTCIMKVPILAQCLTAERAKFRPVAASAASTPLLFAQDESRCSPEILYQGIKALSEEELNKLLNCYLFFLDSSEKISNLNTQIEGAEKKEFYQKICSILNDILYEDRQRIFTEHWWVRRNLSQVKFTTDTHRILSGLGNLSNLFKKKGDYERALTLYEQIVARSKRVLGDDHPDTLIYLNSLAAVRKKVEEQQQKEGAGVAQADVPVPDTLASLNSLAASFFNKGEFDRALPLLEECLAQNKRVLGDDHPRTLESLNNLAQLFLHKREYDRALPMYEECLAKRKRVLGEDHPETLKSLNSLAASLYLKDEYDRALPLLEECLAQSKRVLGDDHPDTLTYLENLAAVRKKVEEQRAYKLQIEALYEEVRKEVEKQQQKEGAGVAQAEGAGVAQAEVPVPSKTLPKSLGGRSKNKRNHKNKSFRSTRRRRRYSRARGGKKIAASSSKTIKRRRKNAR